MDAGRISASLRLASHFHRVGRKRRAKPVDPQPSANRQGAASFYRRVVGRPRVMALVIVPRCRHALFELAAKEESRLAQTRLAIRQGVDPRFIVKFQVADVLNQSHPEFKDLLFFNLNLLQENVGACDVFKADAGLPEFLGTIAVEWEILPPGDREGNLAKILSGRPPDETALQPGPVAGVCNAPARSRHPSPGSTWGLGNCTCKSLRDARRYPFCQSFTTVRVWAVLFDQRGNHVSVRCPNLLD